MVATWKKEEVGVLAKKIQSHKVVGVISLHSMPSKQLQMIKRKLRGEAEIYTSKKSLIDRAFEKTNLKDLSKYLQGPVALILTNMNPFKLEKTLYNYRTRAPAKQGSVAQADIIIPAGDTGLPAGPVIGDVQAAGIKARIQGGKIHVTEEAVVAKKGDKVSDKVAVVLTRLGIEPNEIKLKLAAAHEGGVVYPHDVLHIDETETLARIASACRSAINLSVNAGIYNKESMPYMIQDAFNRARNLMINAGIVNKETVGIFMARADAQAKALKSALPPEVFAEQEAPKEEKKE